MAKEYYNEDMGIVWAQHEEHNAVMSKCFIDEGKDALTMDHYALADKFEKFGYTPAQWKAFLQDKRVQQYIRTEQKVIAQTQYTKLASTIGDSRSMGQATALNAMQKIDSDNRSQTKEGPAVIYAYIPLSLEQSHAPFVEVLDNDPFAIDEDMANDLVRLIAEYMNETLRLRATMLAKITADCEQIIRKYIRTKEEEKNAAAKGLST